MAIGFEKILVNESVAGVPLVRRKLKVSVFATEETVAHLLKPLVRSSMANTWSLMKWQNVFLEAIVVFVPLGIQNSPIHEHGFQHSRRLEGDYQF